MMEKTLRKNIHRYFTLHTLTFQSTSKQRISAPHAHRSRRKQGSVRGASCATLGPRGCDSPVAPGKKGKSRRISKKCQRLEPFTDKYAVWKMEWFENAVFQLISDVSNLVALVVKENLKLGIDSWVHHHYHKCNKAAPWAKVLRACWGVICDVRVDCKVVVGHGLVLKAENITFIVPKRPDSWRNKWWPWNDLETAFWPQRFLQGGPFLPPSLQAKVTRKVKICWSTVWF